MPDARTDSAATMRDGELPWAEVADRAPLTITNRHQIDKETHRYAHHR